MRTALPAFFLLAALSTASTACSVTTTTDDRPDYEPITPTVTPVPSTPAPPPRTNRAPAEPKPIDASIHAEVVSVFMRDTTGGRWICTGTLISATTVVTAAHCLDSREFVSYEIVAPFVAGAPHVHASRGGVFGGTFEDVANPDIGYLTLASGVELPRYAELTDVGPRVDSGEALEVAAVVRKSESANAAFETSGTMPLSSTVELGYTHGFGTPLFSKGGDSGAGLFLVENGKVTHKLVGVARQPEPARSLDHFTRIDAEFLAWLGAELR